MLRQDEPGAREDLEVMRGVGDALADLLRKLLDRALSLGEHVDDHQIKFARQIAKSGMVDLAEQEGDLRALLDALYEAAVRPSPPQD